jgi:hypothetical protein
VGLFDAAKIRGLFSPTQGGSAFFCPAAAAQGAGNLSFSYLPMNIFLTFS